MAKKENKVIQPAGNITEIKTRCQLMIAESDKFVTNAKQDWDKNMNLYMGELEEDDNLPEWKTRLFLNMTFGIVNSDVSGSMAGLITANDFYSLYSYRKSGKKKGIAGILGGKVDLDMSATVLEKVMKVQEQEARLWTEIYHAVKDCSIKGKGIIMVDWVDRDKPKEYLDTEKGEIVTVKQEYKVRGPRFQSIAPEDFIIHPKAKTVDESPYAGHWYNEFTSNIIDNPFYNVKEEVAAFIRTYTDKGEKIPENVRLAMIYDDRNQVHVLTEGGFVLKSHHTPWKHNKKPYPICIKNPLPRSTNGVSTVDAYADIQEVMNATVCDFVDANRMSIFRSFLVGAGFESKTPMQMRPGAMYTVRNVEQFKEFGVSAPPADIYRLFEQFDSFTNRILGNLDQVDTTGVNTAAEAKLIYSRAASTFRDFVNYNRENFIRPIIKLWIELNQQFLTVEDIRGLVPEDQLEKIGFEEKTMDIEAPFGFYVTGEKNLEDRQTQLDKVQVFTNIMAQMGTLPTEINRAALIKRVVKSLDLGDDILAEAADAPPSDKKPAAGIANQEQIAKEIAVMAQNAGMTPEQMLSSLAQKMGKTEEDVLLGIEQSGSVNAFMQAAAAQGPQIPDIPAEVVNG